MGNERIFKHSFGVYFDKGDEHILLKFIEEVTKLGWIKTVSRAEKEKTHNLFFNSHDNEKPSNSSNNFFFCIKPFLKSFFPQFKLIIFNTTIPKENTSALKGLYFILLFIFLYYLIRVEFTSKRISN